MWKFELSYSAFNKANFCLVYSIGCNKKKQGMDGKSLAKDSS